MGELIFSKCQRCNGVMAYDKFYGAYEHFWGWRCLTCGEIVDPIILENRQMMSESRYKHPNDEEVKKKWTRPLIQKNTG